MLEIKQRVGPENLEKYSNKTIKNLFNNILNNLKLFIDHTAGNNDIYFTPFDFDILDISQSDLNCILNSLK